MCIYSEHSLKRCTHYCRQNRRQNVPTLREKLKEVVADIRELKKKKIAGIGYTMLDDMKMKGLFELQAGIVKKIERSG